MTEAQQRQRLFPGRHLFPDLQHLFLVRQLKNPAAIQRYTARLAVKPLRSAR